MQFLIAICAIFTLLGTAICYAIFNDFETDEDHNDTDF